MFTDEQLSALTGSQLKVLGKKYKIKNYYTLPKTVLAEQINAHPQFGLHKRRYPVAYSFDQLVNFL